MTSVLGAIGLLLLLAHCAAWAALLVGLAKRKPAWRAAVALLLPPLAALWGWEAGLRRRTFAYGATLAAFVVLVMATNLAR